MSEEELCALARNGDAEAEDNLIRELLPSLRITAEEFVKRYGGLQIEADDLIQEASIRIYAELFAVFIYIGICKHVSVCRIDLAPYGLRLELI